MTEHHTPHDQPDMLLATVGPYQIRYHHGENSAPEIHVVYPSLANLLVATAPICDDRTAKSFVDHFSRNFQSQAEASGGSRYNSVKDLTFRSFTEAVAGKELTEEQAQYVEQRPPAAQPQYLRPARSSKLGRYFG